ncbi:MAG: RloB family protein [Fusobacteriaceae bacterium]|jgi:hypothetical protein|nr:RloB family protein [Fusobacteriaceae bacterium]
MKNNQRNGKRESRDSKLRSRAPVLGYYIIVTDATETEINYFNGLRDSIPEEIRRRLIITTYTASTERLIQDIQQKVALHPQYCEPWIIFDRDRVPDFDNIIRMAKRKGIHVGWSNPCIEIWFLAYFGLMPNIDSSVACCNVFGKEFERTIKQEYLKSDRRIYTKLNQFGDEKIAINMAWQKYKEARNNHGKPSEMVPCTTVHVLVEEIKNKVGKTE